MKVALAQFPVSVGNPQENIRQIYQHMDTAGSQQSDLLVLPEMCTTGFNWANNREYLTATKKDLEAMVVYAGKRNLAFCGSFLEQVEDGTCANTFYYFDATGRLCAKYRKVHLFSLFQENLNVTAGKEIITAETNIGKIGCSICYDLRFPELFRKCISAGAEIQILVAAFPHPRLSHWRNLIRARALENQVFFIAVNQCGEETHCGGASPVTYFGHSMIVDPSGEIIFEADEKPGLFQVEVDHSLIAQARKGFPVLRDCRPDVYRQES